MPHYTDPLRWWESCPKARTAQDTEGSDLPFGPNAPCECGVDERKADGGPIVLRLLALPHDDHDDYRQEWAA